MFWLVLPIPKYIIYTWGLSGLAGLLNKKKSSKKVKKKGSKKNLCGEGGEGGVCCQAAYKKGFEKKWEEVNYYIIIFQSL
jgi:hypothetical protein